MDREIHKCSQCGERLSKAQTETKFGEGWKEETKYITPCSRCIEQALADRGVFIIVRIGQDNGDEYQPDCVVSCWNVFFTQYEASAKLTQLVEGDEVDLNGVIYTRETHQVMKLDRRE